MGSATNTYYEEEIMSVWEEGQQMLHEEEMETFRRSQEDDRDFDEEPEPVEVKKQRMVKCWKCGIEYPAKDIGHCFND